MRALLALVLVLTAAAPAPAAEPGLVYVGGDVVVAAADGSGPRPVVVGSHDDYPVDPVWSADGTTLAFAWQSMIISSQYSPPPLIAMRRLGRRSHPELPGERSGVSPAWSPDGAGLVVSDRGLRVVDLATGSRRTLTSGERYDRDADVSPDGRWVAFTRDHRTVWLVPMSGGDAVLVADGAHPSWSPDGRRLAFSVDGDIAIRDLVTQTTDRIEAPGDDVEPAWSPDGRRILFSSDRDFRAAGSYEIHAMDPDGGCVTQLTWGGLPARQPDPRPGVRAHRGSCGRRTLRFRTPKISGRWLHAGPRVGDRLMSFYGRYVAYLDCARPGRCRMPVRMWHRNACGVYSPPETTGPWRPFGRALLSRGKGFRLLATGGRVVEVRGADRAFLRRLGRLERPAVSRLTWRVLRGLRRAVRRHGLREAGRRHYRSVEGLRRELAFLRALERARAKTC